MQGLPQRNLNPIHSVKSGTLHDACSTSQNMDANLVISGLLHTARLMNSLARSFKKIVTKVQWLYWRIHDNRVAYFRIWSRRSLHRFCGRAQTYWSQSDGFNSPKPCYVMLTIRDQNPSLGTIGPGDPHQRNLNAPKIWGSISRRDERQERYAREAAWKMARCILELKEKNKNNILLTFGELVSTFAINN